MIDRSTFNRYVHEVFDRLDDPSYLATHGLAVVLFGAGSPASPEMLRRALLNAVSQIRPPEDSAHDSISWRRWRALTLRHVEGLNSRQIARDLQISLRQAQRDQQDGVEAVATLLWAKREAQARPRSDELRPGGGRDDLQTELTRAAELADAGAASVDLAEVVASATATLRELIATRGARLDVAIPPELGPVVVDRSALRQIVLCLLAAALDSVSPKIRLSAAHAGDRVEVLLERDSQRPSARREATDAAEATTLIDTARRFVELQSGTFESFAKLDGSLEFRLSLPATPIRIVLVIDDNPDLAELFRAYLAGTPYRIVQARTVPLALRLARELHPDIITLDVLMPTQDGWQILQELRADPTLLDVPVIVCSIVPERPLAMTLGADAFLAKPVTPRSLLTTIEACLSRRSPAGRPGSPAGSQPARQRSDHPTE